MAELTRIVFRELGAEPTLSKQATVDLFDTHWLDRGSGLVLEDRGTVVGLGWARDSTWRNRKYVQVGLFLLPGYRKRSKYRALTERLMTRAIELGHYYGTSDALIYYRSVDEVHPPVVREIGFRDLPDTMIGFRHDLQRIPDPSIPENVRLRRARLPQEKELVMSLGRKAFDDPANQGEPMHEDYFNLIVSRPCFRPDQVLIAEDGHGAAGYAILSRDERPNNPPELVELGVLPASRRLGIGSALVARLLAWCHRRQAYSVIAAAFSTNRVGTLFWRLGFRPDPLRTYYFFTRKL